MMLAFNRWFVAAVALIALAPVGRASAQIVIGRGPGVVVRAPYAPAIRVGARIGVPGVPLVRPYLLPRRRVVGAAVGPVVPPVAATAGAAVPAPREVARYAPGQTAVSAQRPFLSADQLAALDDGSLLNAALDAAVRLDADLGRFNTGATWQRYLRLPDDAFPPADANGHVELGFNSITGTMERLNSVERNPNYAMISRLPSFAATQLALGEVVARFGGAGQGGAEVGPSASASRAEELPTPLPSTPTSDNVGAGQRSILAR
jgi:hypothetical protein